MNLNVSYYRTNHNVVEYNGIIILEIRRRVKTINNVQLTMYNPHCMLKLLHYYTYANKGQHCIVYAHGRVHTHINRLELISN